MDIAKNYDFVIQENPPIDHPYFLHDYLIGKGERYFCARLLKKQKVKALVYLVLKSDGTAISIKNAPFGGVWTEKKIASDSLQLLISELLLALKALGAKRFKVVQPPDAYEDNNPLVHYILKAQGFRLEGILLHHFLEDKKFIKGFIHAKLSKHKKKIKKINCNVETGSIKTFNFLKDIKWWRTQRGHEYNVNEEKLIQQVSAYPDRYFLVSLYQGEQAAAHALCVKLTPNSLYYYLPAINPDLQHAYTGEGLLFEVIRMGEALGVDFIDLGSSDLDGQPNHNLIRYKMKNANGTSNKLVWDIKF
ncbi:GNAT family N-acetyltransferase [Echinicola strongylocentroti]|uniref:GNAT family N-acetyltransferase n=1 Tax=Echinicola strongylocentroti TaxID=1795355 RepID=A0A2Z4INX2_9BACT|nr:GNAT family N-acetyltransferase [Echinicola strongylocentroti]AWW32318.1 GNAT family N-acetyltransferase [Echinicola strongylocentroti]